MWCEIVRCQLSFGRVYFELLASQGKERDHYSKRNSSDTILFVAMKVPDTNCIFVSNRTAKKLDSANVGYQFERLVTGGDMYG